MFKVTMKQDCGTFTALKLTAEYDGFEDKRIWNENDIKEALSKAYRLFAEGPEGLFYISSIKSIEIIKESSSMKSIIEKRTGLKLQDILLNEFGGHEVGKKYYCGYWQKTFEVVKIKDHPTWGWVVVCKWDDGQTNEHCTSLQFGKDFEVLEVA